MNECNKCKKLVKSMVYPNSKNGYKLLIKSQVLEVYECEVCKSKIKNTHMRYGYQTEYLPVNSIITDEEYNKLLILENL